MLPEIAALFDDDPPAADDPPSGPTSPPPRAELAAEPAKRSAAEAPTPSTARRKVPRLGSGGASAACDADARRAAREERYGLVPPELMHLFNVANALVKPRLEAFFFAVARELPELSQFYANNRRREKVYRRAAKAVGIRGRDRAAARGQRVLCHVSRQRHGANALSGPDSHADIKNPLWFEPAPRNIKRRGAAMAPGTQIVLAEGLNDEQQQQEEDGDDDDDEEEEEAPAGDLEDGALAALQDTVAEVQCVPPCASDEEMATSAVREAANLDVTTRTVEDIEEVVRTAAGWVAALRAFAAVAGEGACLATEPVSPFVRHVLHYYVSVVGARAGLALQDEKSADTEARRQVKPMRVFCVVPGPSPPALPAPVLAPAMSALPPPQTPPGQRAPEQCPPRQPPPRPYPPQQPPPPPAAPSAFRTYLDTPFAQKDACKALGGRWDRKRKAWYAPAGVDLSPFLQQWCQRHDLNAQRVP